jgi:hypothetical protein
MRDRVRLAVVVLTAVFVFVSVASGFGVEATGLPGDGLKRAQASDSQNVLPPTPQTWTVVSDWGPTAIVVVSPFTYSGTFNEVDTSPGWRTWHHLCDSTGAVVDSVLMRIPVNGTIAHSGAGDAWSFTITVMNNGVSYTGSGEGTSDGSFPDAMTASGTYSVSMSAEGYEPGEVSGTWTAYRD